MVKKEIEKNLKLSIKNTQIAQAIQLDKLKEKLAQKKADTAEKEPKKQALETKEKKAVIEEPEKHELEEPPRRKARARSHFAEPRTELEVVKEKIAPMPEQVEEMQLAAQAELEAPPTEQPGPAEQEISPETVAEAIAEELEQPTTVQAKEKAPPFALPAKREVLGPTGKHIKDILPPKIAKKSETVEARSGIQEKTKEPESQLVKKEKTKKAREREEVLEIEPAAKKGDKTARFKEFRDLKPTRRQDTGRFDARDRHGLRSGEEDQRWRKRKPSKASKYDLEQEDITIRPKSLSVRIPISVKDLAGEMKLKGSQLIQKLFLQGIVITINDLLDDETTIQILGEEFGCAISIDTSEEERIRITDKTIKEEIKGTEPEYLKIRAPVVTFMGHVDHGKTSLIDYIRKSNRTAGEAGAITQHIGAFLCKTEVGNIAVLDTPGHEAFSAMRARGADVTDIVVLVIAGDEGMRAQTEEAINHAKAAGVTIVVAINKCDKPNFNAENVFRQLAEHSLLPEAWGGQTITVKCSAITGQGVKELLEMLALQAEVLELKANPDGRARGTVLESELHKGMGPVATVLVQNGTLRIGDSLVFGEHWGRVKTMHDEFGNTLTEAPPSTPVGITGISGLPEAGEEFIVLGSEKEARGIGEDRMIGKRQLYLQQSKKIQLEGLLQQEADKAKKILRIVLRADVQGSLEALKAALLKIESDKIDLDIISAGVGEISESDVLLAAASKAMILAFHTQVESHADTLVKQHGVHVSQHDIIYHAIDDIKGLMTGLLDKIAQETERGKAEVLATFKSSQLGVIAGCRVTEGVIHRNHQIRVKRNGEELWRGSMSSLKRVKEDVREVQKGVECGILLNGFNAVQEGDILEAFEITYISQVL